MAKVAGMKFSTDAKVVMKNIAAIKAITSSLANDIHVTAVSAIIIAIKHGNTTPINALDEALRGGVAKNGKTGSVIHLAGLRKYFEMHGPVSFVKEDKANAKPEHFKLSKDKQTDLAEQMAMNEKAFVDEMLRHPFYLLVPQPEYKGFDFAKVLAQAVKQAKKTMDDETKANHPGTKIDPALLRKFMKFLSENNVTVN